MSQLEMESSDVVAPTADEFQIGKSQPSRYESVTQLQDL